MGKKEINIDKLFEKINNNVKDGTLKIVPVIKNDNIYDDLYNLWWILKNLDYQQNAYYWTFISKSKTKTINLDTLNQYEYARIAQLSMFNNMMISINKVIDNMYILCNSYKDEYNLNIHNLWFNSNKEEFNSQFYEKYYISRRNRNTRYAHFDFTKDIDQFQTEYYIKGMNLLFEDFLSFFNIDRSFIDSDDCIYVTYDEERKEDVTIIMTDFIRMFEN